MTQAKIIHCPLYGPVPIDPLAVQCIDTPEFQRLHHIRQTGMVYRVFPSACHSRFTHAIGTYHLAGVWFDHLTPQLDPRRRQLIQLAGLLHDIGHGPYSHVFEKIVQRRVQSTWSHEQQSIDIFHQMVTRYALPVTSEEVEFVCHCIRPPDQFRCQWQYQLINNAENGLDVDKMDYLRRDMWAIGLPCGVDIQRILVHSHLVEGKIVFEEKVATNILDLYYQRYKMYRTIYQHRVVLHFDALIEQAVSSIPHLDRWVHNMHQFCQLTDGRIMELCEDQYKVDELSSRTHSNATSSFVPVATIVGGNLRNQQALQNVRFCSGRTLDQLELPMARLCLKLSEQAWL